MTSLQISFVFSYLLQHEEDADCRGFNQFNQAHPGKKSSWMLPMTVESVKA
ncbi:MAG TPA: hypothetical protein VHB45_04655 [Alloacidobacterium sp.]|nr:hypothetical protein [Alloacidobacterium sp.]